MSASLLKLVRQYDEAVWDGHWVRAKALYARINAMGYKQVDTKWVLV